MADPSKMYDLLEIYTILSKNQMWISIKRYK